MGREAEADRRSGVVAFGFGLTGSVSTFVDLAEVAKSRSEILERRRGIV